MKKNQLYGFWMLCITLSLLFACFQPVMAQEPQPGSKAQNTVFLPLVNRIELVAPSRPILLTPYGYNPSVPTQVTLTWKDETPNATQAYYDLYLQSEDYQDQDNHYYDEYGMFVPNRIVAQNLTTSQWSTTLEPGTTYYWKVVAHNNAGQTQSYIRNFTTAGGSLTLEKQLGGGVSSIAMNGNAIYADVGGRIIAADVSDLANPQVTWQSDILGDHVTKIVTDSQIMVAMLEDNLYIFDVTSPFHPVELKQLHMELELTDILLSDHLLYVTTNTAYAVHSTLLILDLQNPSVPVEKGHLSASHFYTWQRLILKGSTLYCLRGDALDMIDVTDPKVPVFANSVSTGNDYLTAFLTTDEYIYLVGNPFNQKAHLQVYSLVDPLTPELKFDTEISGAGKMALNGDQLFLQIAGAFKIYSIADPESPVELGTGNISSGGFASDLMIVSDHLFFASAKASYGLQIFNVSDYTNIQLIGKVPLPGNIVDVDTNGDLLYLLQGNYLSIYRQQAKGNLTFVGELKLPCPYVTLAHYGTWIYIGGPSRVSVIDASDPANPILVTEDIYYGIDGLDMEIYGNSLYIIHAAEVISFYVAEDPAHPIQQDYELFSGSKLSIIGNHGYAYGGNGIMRFNVHPDGVIINPTKETYFQVYAIAESENYLYTVSEGKIKIWTYEETLDTRHLVSSWFVGENSSPSDLYLDGDHLWVSSRDNENIILLDISDPLNVRKLGSYNTPGGISDIVPWNGKILAFGMSYFPNQIISGLNIFSTGQ